MRINMRILLTALLLIAGVSAAQAQVRVGRADIVRHGIYKLDKYKSVNDKSISTGQRTTATKITFSRRTDRVVVGDGVVFGLDVYIHGSPSGKKAPMRIVWRYPEPGLRNPDSGKAKYLDDYIDQRTLDTESTFYWSLGDPWTQVPGKWTFELWYGNRMLATQSFTLVKEGGSGSRPVGNSGVE
jgi:Domain of unknown function (DUF3859)